MLTDLSLRYLLRVSSHRSESDPMPMVVLIHGRGADANDLADLAPLLDTPSGCRFVFPNAPRPFEAYPGMSIGWTWFDGWPPRQDSVAESRAVLLHFIDELVERYPTTSLVVSGFSQGGMMSFEAGLRTEQKIAGIVCMSGGLYDKDLPDLRVRAGLPVLMAHGTQDDVVPIQYARRARLVLEEAGLAVEYHEYAMGHQVVPPEIAAVRDFLVRTTAG